MVGRETRGDAVSESPRRFDPDFDFHLDPPSHRYGFAAAPPAAEVAGSPLPLQPRRGRHPSSASSAPKGRHPSAPLQPCRGAIPQPLFSPEGAPSLSPSSAPKGRHPSAQGSALGTGHTPDSQPRRGAIAGRAVPMDCRYAAPAGLNLVLDSFPGRCPGLRNGRAFSAPRPLAFATRPAGSLPQESGDPFCSPEAETIETEAPTELTCAPQGGRAVSKLAAWLPVRA